LVRYGVVALLLVLLSLAPMAAYFGWFRAAEPVLPVHALAGAAAAPPIDAAWSADADHAVRSRLWQKYVGRAPLKHDQAIALPALPARVQAPGVLAFRDRFVKGDAAGEFIQHSQDARIWLEIGDEPAPVFAWFVVQATTDNARRRRILQLEDRSMPQRAENTLTLELPLTTSEQVAGDAAVGAYSYGVKSRQETFASHPLRCRDGMCRVPSTTVRKEDARVVYKSNGGVFMELDGDVWAESNQDGGQLIFFWGVVRESPSQVIFMDAGRNMWLKVKPLPPRGSTLQDGVILLATGQKDASEEGSWSPWTLLCNVCDPLRTCRAALKKQDAERKAKGIGKPLHFVFSVTAMPKFEWQSRFFMYWYNVSQTITKRGSVTRLLTAARGDHLMGEVPTFVAKPPVDDLSRDAYVPYNKITSVLQWIQAKHDELPADAIVCIIDVDVVLLEDIAYMVADVERGKPLGAKGFMSFAYDDSPYDRMIGRYCKGCKEADPLAVPYIIHKTDLLELAPKWLEKCREIRADTQPWHKVTDWRAVKGLQLSWTAEQWAYLLTAAEMGLRHQVREDMSSFTGCGVLQLDEPMIHFSDWTKGIDQKGAVFKWSKGMPNALDVVPDVDPNNPCEIDRAMISALKDARAHVKPTGHVFANGEHMPEF
jgi:hypothetical protein